MAAVERLQAEEEENFGPQPLCRLEVCTVPKPRDCTPLAFSV